MVKQDNLPIAAFQNPDGSNYRQAKEITKAQMAECCRMIGAEMLEFHQMWRHACAKIRRDGQVLFLKMASTTGIAERTKNEVSWNTQLQPLVHEPEPFIIPKIIETGMYQELYYYIAEYYPGEVLSKKPQVNESKLTSWLDRIVRTNAFLLSLPAMTFDRDRGPLDDERWQKNDDQKREWFEASVEANIRGANELLDLAFTLRDVYRPGVCHGDFVPWHMIEDGERFALVDGEHASGYQARYYDIAYFYHRVFTNGGSPAVAKEYLRRIIDRQSSRKDFLVEFRPVLAGRVLGGIWDAKNDKLKDLTAHQQLVDDCLAGELI